MRFASFKPSHTYDAPDYLKAELEEEKAKAQARALRNQDITGAIGLYNEAMGDATPIADYLGIETSKPSALEQAQTKYFESLTSGMGDAAAVPDTAGSVADSIGGSFFQDAVGTGAAETAGSIVPEVAAIGAGGAGTGIGAATPGLAASLGKGGAATLGADAALGSGLLTGAAGALPPVLAAAVLSRMLGLWS